MDRFFGLTRPDISLRPEERLAFVARIIPEVKRGVGAGGPLAALEKVQVVLVPPVFGFRFAVYTS